jgi:hypothetical protein
METIVSRIPYNVKSGGSNYVRQMGEEPRKVNLSCGM